MDTTNLLNPWLYMWFKPRETIRQIVTTNPNKHIYLLASLAGIYQFLDNVSDRSMGDSFSLPVILGFALVAGSIIGIVRLAIEGWLFSLVGGWFGGQANTEKAQAAVAWSYLPQIVYLVVFVFIILIFGHSWFTSELEGIAPLPLLITIAFLVILGIVGFFWRAFILINSLAEVHHFSAWNAVATILVSYTLIAIPFIILFVVYLVLSG